MAIPADNGKPRLEKNIQELKIFETAKCGGFVKKELRLNRMEGKKETYLGKIG